MEPYIILDGVSKSFRSVEVLKPLSIEFEEGLIHGIVGRNGSGKTVMMKLILGFLKPTQGTVTVGKKKNVWERMWIFHRMLARSLKMWILFHI